MIQKTSGWIIYYTKFNDKDLILNCYTYHYGYVSFFYKNAFLSTNKNYSKLFIFNEIEIEFIFSKKQLMKKIKSISHKNSANGYPSLIQGSIAIVISQILKQILINELSLSHNKFLYNFLKQKYQQWILGENSANYIWKFCVDLTEYLGFPPNIRNFDFPYFNLATGVFTSSCQKGCLSESQTILWKKIFSQSYLSRSERKELLIMIFKYFKFHYIYFKPPSSIEILEEIFDS